MTQIVVLDGALRQAMGFGAQVIGTLFNVYRLNSASTGNWVQPSNLVLSGFPGRIVFGTPKVIEEQTMLNKMTYTGMIDTRQLQVNDVLVETGPDLVDLPDGRSYIFADVRPLQGPVLIRCDFLGGLSRPNSASTVSEPILGDGGYQGTSKFNEWPYQLVAGSFYVASGPITVDGITSTGQPCGIPMGMQPHIRVGPRPPITDEYFPTTTPRAVFFTYVPTLPGVPIQPGDMIMNSIGDRYQIENVSYFDTAIQGYQLIVYSVFI